MGNPNYRVFIPQNSQEIILLGENIVAKHTSDGVNSPLSVINMADMEDQVVAARAKDTLALQLNRDKETAFEARDRALGIYPGMEPSMPGTVLYYLQSCRDVLLGVYKDNKHLLGDFGYEVARGGTSYTVPKKASKMITLAKQIIAKHTALGLNSPLKSLNMVDFAAKTTTADSENTNALSLTQEKENTFLLRDRILGTDTKQNFGSPGTVRYFITAVRDILVGIYKKTETQLGLWGFDVQTSPKPKPVVASMRGTITNHLGETIQNAQIKVVELNITVNSGSDGKYVVPKQTAGTYTVEVSKTNYVTQTFNNILFADNQVFVLDVQLISITGTLIANVFSEGAPLENAIVRILETGAQQTTNADGQATFNTVVPGTYNVEASAAGKQAQTVPVTIQANSTASISFDLVNI